MNTPTAIAATQTKLTTTIRLMSLGLETSVVMSAWKMVRKTNAGRSLEKINIILKMGEFSSAKSFLMMVECSPSARMQPPMKADSM